MKPCPLSHSRERALKLVAPLILLLSASLVQSSAEEKLSWQKTTNSVALLQNDQVVWRFNYGDRETKPNFHPVILPHGPLLTWDKPEDHLWHRALWFSWKFINGVNYWEEDPKTGQAAGKTSWDHVQIETKPDFSARIIMDLSYRPAKGEAVLTERRAIEISKPDAQGAYFLDWDMTFKALRDVLFDRTPLPNEPDGKIYGGYAGLSVRLAREIKDIQTVTLAGPVEFASGRYRGKSPAMDYTGTFGGQEAGVAIFDHPENLNSPSPWYAINDNAMHYFSPAVICYGPHTLKAGETMILRYRVAAHPGRWSTDRLLQESLDFAKKN